MFLLNIALFDLCDLNYYAVLVFGQWHMISYHPRVKVRAPSHETGTSKGAFSHDIRESIFVRISRI